MNTSSTKATPITADLARDRVQAVFPSRATAIPENLQLVQLVPNNMQNNITTLFSLLKHKIHQNLTVWHSFKFFQIMVILSAGKERCRKVQKDAERCRKSQF